MALEHCTDCGHEVSSEATGCPNCARPWKKIPVGWRAAFGPLGAFLAVALPIAATIISLIVGVIEYRKAQRWRRTEFVIAQMKEFEQRRDVQLAMAMLDWNDRSYKLEGESEPEVKVTDDTLLGALVPHPSKPDGRFSSTEARIRDIFDAYFSGVDYFAAMVEVGVITVEDLKPYGIKYYLDIIGRPGRKQRAVVEEMWKYLECYEFTGVQRLLRTYGHNVAVSPIPGC